MKALWPLTMANLRSFVRDRAALFWTFAFPILFVILFGSLFSGGGPDSLTVGWVDQDQSAASGGLRQGFQQTGLLELRDGDEATSLEQMRDGDLDAVIVVPSGLGQALVAGAAGAAADQVSLTVYTDPSQQTQSQTIQQVVSQIVSATNLAISGRPPVLGMQTASIQTQEIGAAAYFVPSILAMALMQLGIFAAVPLVGEREKLILKRLGATPLPRWTLVTSNIALRLVIGLIQTVIIVGIGVALFDVRIVGSLLLAFGFVVLGSIAFISIGYVIAAFARTEESAQAVTSIVQFPMMFLSGIFFPIAFMPAFLQPIATLLPLTYLGDALRQTMVGGVPFAPLWVDALVLAGWLVVTFLISARFFRWQ
jgi:ABC-2 type transport system permease protein